MEHIMPIVLLWLTVTACSVRGEPLHEALQRRSVYSVYADDFGDEYEPVAVAAFPLHQPLPLVRLLSSATLPAHGHTKRAPHRHQPAYQATYQSSYQSQPPRDHRDQYVYASSVSEPEYTYSYEESNEQPTYASSSTRSKYTKYSSPSYEEYEAPAPVVVYARPNKSGGYSYRPKPTRPAAKPQEPVIIRVHKYKIIRD